jgi:Uma2 family endonuclease
METDVRRRLLATKYLRYEQEYLYSLPMEHFMEATSQSKQREITLESLALVHAVRPEVQVFNELLVQYPRRGQQRPGQVVPDNMVVVHDQSIVAEGSFNLPLQPATPFWVLEYVSSSNPRKDYDDNMVKYERELKVPYYLMFRPEIQELALFRMNSRKRYATVLPNKSGRFAIRELEIEVAIVEEWMRFWYQGELLQLPGELLGELNSERKRREVAEERADAEKQRADALEARLRELERAKKNGGY